MQDINLFKNKESLYFILIKKKDDLKSYDCDGFLVSTNGNEKEARRIIESIKQKDKSKKIAVVGRDDAFNRRALETLKIDYLVSPENNDQKDTLKQRSSGLNHVLAKIAKEKNIIISENLSLINSMKEKKEKSFLISRIIQNIKICRKAKCKMAFANFSNSEEEKLDEKQISAIGFSLGMSSQQVKF